MSGADADLSQEFLVNDSSDDDSAFNSSLEEDEDDISYLLPLFQIEEEGEAETLTKNTTAEQGALFETGQTKGNPAEEKLFPFSSTTSSAEEDGGMIDGVVKEMEDQESHEVGVVVQNGNETLALQDDNRQFTSSDEKDHNKEGDGNEFHTTSSVIPHF